MTPPSPITVAVAHFDDLLAMGLRALLADDPALSVVARDLEYAHLSRALSDHRPDVLIADAGALDDLAQVRELSLRHPRTHLVLFADGVASPERSQLMAFGASACLSWDTQARDVRSAIHLASRGMQITPLASHPSSGASEREPLLTPREGDVLLLLRKGLGNGQIALELHIGVETVRTHARHIYRKLGVASRRALLALPAPSA